MSDSPDASIVIVSFNTRDLLRECIGTLYREAGGVNIETIVIDNASKDGSADMVAAEFPALRLIRSETNLGFAAANNRGFAVARGRYVVLLNSDAFPKPTPCACRWKNGPRTPRRPGRRPAAWPRWLVAALGADVPVDPQRFSDALRAGGENTRTRIFLAASIAPGPIRCSPAPVDWVPGAFSIIRRDLLERIGYFDERFFSITKKSISAAASRPPGTTSGTGPT